MKTLLSALSFVLLVGVPVLGVAISTATSTAAEAPPVEGRGCCSYHDGVCGCSEGRVQCCDGTTSPSCKC